MGRSKTISFGAMLLVMVTAIAPLLLTVALPAGDAVGQQKARADVERVEAASQDFIVAISARDIQKIDKLWAHDSYVTFIGPLSTTIVVGWEGVRRAWEMRLGQFDRVTISLAESRVHTNGKVAWAVGIEKVQLLRKNGDTLSFDAFVTNVFEKHDMRRMREPDRLITPSCSRLARVR
jgi:ketosteroid isomerase-like protein